MDDLIGALEAATEGSRELSDRVLMACGWVRKSVFEFTPPDRGGRNYDFCSDPTRNLQDAVDLVPTGWRWAVGVPWKKKPFASVQGCSDSGPPGACNGNTAALALCISILSAKL